MSEVSRRSLALLGVIMLLVMMPVAAMAQSTTEGAISGTVYDVQGAVVPKATVMVRNIGTNAEQSVTSDDSGFFRVIRLQPAVYEVTITTTGFAPYKAANVTVNVGTTTELSPHLKPAGSSETVEVQGELPQVNTTSSEFAPVVSEIEIKNLPINGGRWSNFVLLTPGVVNDSSGFGLVSFRGMSILQNNNTVDGADNNQAFFAEERGRTRAGYSTAKSAIQEFQVNTSNYSVEYGRAVGGVVNTVTKSGTNQLHGDLYFYDRDNNWGATNPFTTLTTATQTSPGVFAINTRPYKPKDWRKMVGAGVGGPIIKDKLFFFFAYDFYQRNFPGLAVPSNATRFFAAPSCGATSAATPCTASSVIGTLSTRIYGANNVANNAKAIALYNQDLADLITTLGPNDRTGTQYIYLPKIDWQINGKNHLSFVYNRMNWDSPAGIQTQASNTNGRQSFGNDFVRVQWGVLKLNTTITNNIVNEFRTQYGRDFEFQNPQTPTTPYEQSTLVTNSRFPGYTNPLGLPPEVTITNGWNLGVANFLTRNKYPDERRQQYADTMTWSNGKHLLKFGGDFTHVSDDTSNLRFQYGSYSYGSLLNYFSDLHATNSCRASSTSVNPPPNTPVPCYTNFQQAFGPLGFKFSTNDYGFFAQDDWKLLPRLTVSLGLRWDYQQLPDPFTNLINTAAPQTGRIPTDKNNFGPRAGFAWDVFGDGKTSLRGGFAMTYGRTINSTIYNALTNTGVNGSQLQYTITPNSVLTCTQQFPKIFRPDGSDLPAGCNAGRSIVFFQNDFQNPKVYHVNVSIDRQLSSNTVLQLSYLGSFGRDLPIFVDTNIDPTSRIINTYAVCGVNGSGATDLTSCFTPGAGQPIQTPTYSAPFYTKRLNSAFGAMTEIRSYATSTYNAFVAQVNRRMSRHFQYNTNFTWSHAIDLGQNNTTFTQSNGVLDPYDLKQEKGNSNQNVPFRFVASVIAETPWKKSGWLGYVANDWQVSPLWQWQNGLPYSLRTSGTPSGGFQGNGGINGSNGDFRLYNTRNIFRQPDTQVWDLKLTKGLRFSERYTAELSAEVFNMFNHVNVTAVGTTGYFIGTAASASSTTSGQSIANGAKTLTYNTGVFGIPSNANSNFAYSPRQVQLGAKFKF